MEGEKGHFLQEYSLAPETKMVLWNFNQIGGELIK